MITSARRSNPTAIGASVRLLRLSLGVSFALLSSSLFARQVPENLGYGLDKLVEDSIARRHGSALQFGGYTSRAAAYYGERAIRDEATGRVMVDILPNGRVPFEALRTQLQGKLGSLTITAVDAKYRSTGILEGWVSVDEAAVLAQMPGVNAVFLALQPYLDSVPTRDEPALSSSKDAGPAPNAAPGDTLAKIGTAFDQGVTQHGVDKINQFYNASAALHIDGTGITLAAMSDSFDKKATGIHAPQDVTSFDLPGAAGHPAGNTQPVAVIHEYSAAGSDEGRAMVQILHKMAPKARLGFASGFFGEVQFAYDIHALAGDPAYPPTVPQSPPFKADVIVDDISYGGEPFWGESIIGNAIDEVTAQGVSYFSSAGNNIGINAYESTLRVVPNGTGLTSATNSALAGTNINLANVPTSAYAGGFHNFNPISGQLDVAQLVNLPESLASSQGFEMQWDDPYDQRPLTLDQPALYNYDGTVPASGSVTIDQTSTPPLPVFNVGKAYVIQETATGGSGLDAIIDIYDAGNNLVVHQDTGADETVTFYPSVSGQYHIVVSPFGTTSGAFHITINTADGVSGVTSDFNMLVFDTAGNFLPDVSLYANNVANNRPVESGLPVAPAGQTQVQFVIARGNIPPASATRPTRVRWAIRGNGGGGIGPAEYFTYNATTTKGHATAKGCIGTAAYSSFRPSLPETFTSPGPALILFDKNANRLATPELRQVPKIAATDAANTSFFSSDSASDPDTNPNFGGTSAAAPHAAAIAGLVLQSRGGPGSVTPANMVKILQANTFKHDLDPSSASGSAVASDGGGVVITIDSDGDANTSTGDNDVNSIQVTYLGPGSLATLVFNPTGSAATGGHVTGGNNGVQNATATTVTYFENSYPGLAFLPNTRPFALGTLSGLTPADITAPGGSPTFSGFSNLAPAPGNGTTQFMTMSLAFPTGNFTDSKVLRFTVGRGAAHSSAVNTAGGTGPTGGTVTRNPIADLFGGGVLLPSGRVIVDGMAFSGTTTGGASFSGTIKNKIGHGYSVVDGYGFIDAAAAVDRIFASDND